MDYVGRASAATLGFILGDLPGAYAGYNLYNRLRDSLPNHYEPVTMPVSKRRYVGSMQSRNRKRRATASKPVYRKKSTVKKFKSFKRQKVGRKCPKMSKCTSQQVRKIAQSVVHKERPRAVYEKNILYEAPGVHGSTSNPAQSVYSTLRFGSGVNYFDAAMAVGTTTKIMDAVSVLFNGKVTNLNVPAVGNFASFSQMVIPQFKHTAQYNFCNNTNTFQVFDIYETVPKEDTNTGVYSAWLAMSVPQLGGTTRPQTYFGMRPEMYPQFKDNYRILRKTKKVVAPGRRFTYNMSCQMDHLRFDHWMQPGTTTPWLYRKGFTKELLIINYSKIIVGAPQAGGGGGTIGIEWNGFQKEAFGVAVESLERFSMSCPENVDVSNVRDNAIAVKKP